MLESVLFTHPDPSKVSLNDMAIYHKVHFGIKLTRQAIGKRFSRQATKFVQLILFHLLKANLSIDQEIFTRSCFNRIIIKDSTSNQLPDGLKDKYPGCGGAASKASVKIQFEYNLKTHEVSELAPSAYTNQDIKNSKDTLCNIQKNDLIIRDLGYVSIDILSAIEQRQAWYISRLQANYIVYDKETGKEIDFVKLEVYMRKHNIYFLDKDVFVGEQKYATRLVIELVPDGVKAERVRKAKRQSVRRGAAISDKKSARFGLNLFLTNCTKQMISTSEIRRVYGIRWQIELIFKAWKQNALFHKIKEMNIDRYEFLLYAKLVMILLSWKLHQVLDTYMYQKVMKRISILKLYKTLYRFQEEIKAIFKGNKNSSKAIIIQLQNIGTDYLLHEDRKERINWRNVEII